MIGFAECECIIYDAGSLKEKRAVLKRIITRVQNKFNVSAAEIGYQDTWQPDQLRNRRRLLLSRSGGKGDPARTRVY